MFDRFKGKKEKDLNKEDYQKGYKKFEGEAEEYYEDKKKSKGLLKKAKNKAEDKKEERNLSDVWEDLQLMLQMFRAWIKGDYKELDKKSIIMVIAGILYFVSPIDLIPDFIPIIGFFDDAAVIGFIVNRLTDEVDHFRIWKQKQ